MFSDFMPDYMLCQANIFAFFFINLQVLYHNRRSKPNSLAEEIATVVKEVDKVHGMVFWSPLYWESIEMLARDEVSRGIFYALPDESKLHYLKRKTKASMDPEFEHFW